MCSQPLAILHTQFYFQFLSGGKTYDDEQWLHLQGMSKHNSWLGLSFERLCFAHMPQIRRALGIAGVATKTFAYQTDGAQVDMVIERADKTVCLIENLGNGGCSAKNQTKLCQRSKIFCGLGC